MDASSANKYAVGEVHCAARGIHDTSTLSHVCSHLTDSSINQYAHQGVDFSGGGNSFKWTFEQLCEYFVDNALPWD